MCRAWRLFIEDSAELRFGDDFLEYGEFGAVKVVAALLLWYGRDAEWPDADFANLEWVENVHRDGISALVCEMASDSAAQAFVCLSNVDRFSVVVEKCVDAPLVTTDFLPVLSGGFEKGVYLLTDGDDVRGWTERISG